MPNSNSKYDAAARLVLRLCGLIVIATIWISFGIWPLYVSVSDGWMDKFVYTIFLSPAVLLLWISFAFSTTKNSVFTPAFWCTVWYLLSLVARVM